MNRTLLSILCFVMFSFVAKADEMVVTFGPNNKYAGDNTNKVEFSDVNTPVDGHTFDLPGLGSFTVNLKEGSEHNAKDCAISAGGSGGNAHINIYKDCKVDFAFDAGVTVSKIVFVAPTKTYVQPLTPSTGTCTLNEEAKTMTWEGEAKNALTIGVYKKVTRFMWIEITYTKEGSTGIDEVSADTDVPAEYYNLQGVRVNNPENGVYIMRQGANVQKVYVK